MHMTKEVTKLGPIGFTEAQPLEEESTAVFRKRARSRPVIMTKETILVLNVRKGLSVGRTIELQPGDHLMGRGEGTDVRLHDRGVSRHHARLLVDIRGVVELVDLASTNGTFVNGRRTTRECLRVGDRIRIGHDAVLEFGQALVANGPSAPLVVHARDDGAPALLMHELENAHWGASAPRRRDIHEDIDAYGRLLEIRRRQLGDDHPSVANLLEAIGVAFQDEGHLEQAIGCLTQALAIHVARNPPEPRATARTLTQLARCELELARPRAAVERLEQAEQLLCIHSTTPVELGCIRLSLAHALWNLGTEPERCIALVRLAQAAFARANALHVLHPDVKAWMQRVCAARPEESHRS
jgi:pSer/pThr/pTyr-binding forkhead associated (FHA) protein